MIEKQDPLSDKLPPLLTGPFTWKGPDLRHRDWIMQLTPSDIAELESAVEAYLSQSGSRRLLENWKATLPNLQSKIQSLRNDLLHGKGFMILRGLNLDNYSEEEMTLLFYALGSALGAPRSQNALGHVVGHVYDVGADATDPNVRYYQTNRRQTFHTDSCDVVGLLCVQPALEGGLSLLTSGYSIFNEMKRRRPDLLKLLFQPIATDRRGEVPEGLLPFIQIPVYSYYKNELTVFYRRQYIESAQRFPEAPRLTDVHIEALDLFDQLCNSPEFNLRMMLKRGDIQFVYNHALLHDRTGFTDSSSPEKKRHLLRLWLSVPGDRPLPPSFADRFGSVQIGNRGGIAVSGTKFNIPLLSDLR